MASNMALVKVAAVGGFAVATLGFATRFYFSHRVRGTYTYKEALSTMRSHEKAVHYLGEPITEGTIDIGETEQNTKWFTVGVHGSNTKGELYCEFIPNTLREDNRTEIVKLEIKFDSLPGKTFVMKEG